MRLAIPFALIHLGIGCEAHDEMTVREAVEGLEQVMASGIPSAITSDPIEVSTEFTIGGALEAAADELAAFWQSQAPCSTVTVTLASVDVDYGDLADRCTWRGRSYGGLHSIDVGSTLPEALDLVHGWRAFTDGVHTLDGITNVSWDGASDARRVQTDLRWTDAQGTRTDVTGDHVYGLVSPADGLSGGITQQGVRAWETLEGTWLLDMTGIVFRLDDPLPEAGSYQLTNPDGKQLDLAFQRLDDETIQASLSGAVWPLVFDIDKRGGVSEVR